jgi:hypothetical protein
MSGNTNSGRRTKPTVEEVAKAVANRFVPPVKPHISLVRESKKYYAKMLPLLVESGQMTEQYYDSFLVLCDWYGKWQMYARKSRQDPMNAKKFKFCKQAGEQVVALQKQFSLTPGSFATNNKVLGVPFPKDAQPPRRSLRDRINDSSS